MDQAGEGKVAMMMPIPVAAGQKRPMIVGLISQARKVAITVDKQG
jgi:hypothetical protein